MLRGVYKQRAGGIPLRINISTFTGAYRRESKWEEGAEVAVRDRPPPAMVAKTQDHQARKTITEIQLI